MLTEYQLRAMPERIFERLDTVNTNYLKIIGKRLKELGEIKPSDQHRIERLLSLGLSDIKQIEKELALATAKNAEDVRAIMLKITQDNYEFAKPFYKYRGIEFVPFSKKTELIAYAEGIATRTSGTMANLANSTAVSGLYKSALDQAITVGDLGLESYSASIRSVVREVGASGLQYIEYESGYSKRLDSAVRQNVLAGMKEANLESADRVGKEIGADGYEVSYHSNPRETHADMGGQQYSFEEFENEGIQSLLDDYGCLHYKYPIIIGVSSATYSKQQLTNLKENDKKIFEYEGKKYNKYEASQVQRKLETQIRSQKDIAVIAASSGDKTLRSQVQGNINVLTSKYSTFSKQAGLPTKMERAAVAGFRPVKAK